MKQKLLLARKFLKTEYGSYLATEVFRKERALLGRINRVLLFRYGMF